MNKNRSGIRFLTYLLLVPVLLGCAGCGPAAELHSGAKKAAPRDAAQQPAAIDTWDPSTESRAVKWSMLRSPRFNKIGTDSCAASTGASASVVSAFCTGGWQLYHARREKAQERVADSDVCGCEARWQVANHAGSKHQLGWLIRPFTERTEPSAIIGRNEELNSTAFPECCETSHEI